MLERFFLGLLGYLNGLGSFGATVMDTGRRFDLGLRGGEISLWRYSLSGIIRCEGM